MKCKVFPKDKDLAVIRIINRMKYVFKEQETGSF